MLLTTVVPYEKDRWSDKRRRPTFSYDVKVTEDHPELPEPHVVIEWELEDRRDEYTPRGLSTLADYPEVITKANAHLIWPLVKRGFPVDKVPYRSHMTVIHKLLDINGWSNLYDIFTIHDNEQGWGFMGGTGCGRLIHHLTFSKVLGVREDVAQDIKKSPKHWVKWHLATVLFTSMLGEVKQVREDRKYLRDAIKEDELFVTLHAKPDCQETVRYVGAQGYVVRGAGLERCSCTKCAKKLGVAVDNRGRRMAGAREV